LVATPLEKHWNFLGVRGSWRADRQTRLSIAPLSEIRPFFASPAFGISIGAPMPTATTSGNGPKCGPELAQPLH
jgi:hypothetical protein